MPEGNGIDRTIALTIWSYGPQCEGVMCDGSNTFPHCIHIIHLRVGNHVNNGGCLGGSHLEIYVCSTKSFAIL